MKDLDSRSLINSLIRGKNIVVRLKNINGKHLTAYK
jgi:hypothetical protein